MDSHVHLTITPTSHLRASAPLIIKLQTTRDGVPGCSPSLALGSGVANQTRGPEHVETGVRKCLGINTTTTGE